MSGPVYLFLVKCIVLFLSNYLVMYANLFKNKNFTI